MNILRLFTQHALSAGFRDHEAAVAQCQGEGVGHDFPLARSLEGDHRQMPRPVQVEIDAHPQADQVRGGEAGRARSHAVRSGIGT